VIEVPEEQIFGITAEPTLAWTLEAQERLKKVPGFARGMVVRAVERHARVREIAVVTGELMQEVRERTVGRFPWFAGR
jgi:hypothetical protein